MTNVPFTICWTSAMSGSRRSSSCKTKREALREAKQLYTDGARDISVSQYVNGYAKEINWRIALRNK